MNRNKSIKNVIAIGLVVLSLFVLTVTAHPGRTDSNGGHLNHSTGEYHYHHGYSAHQHTNGECPYEFKDKTDHSVSNDYSKPHSNNKAFTDAPTVRNIIITIIETIGETIIFFVCGAGLLIIICKFFDIPDKVLFSIVILLGVASIILALTTDSILE